MRFTSASLLAGTALLTTLSASPSFAQAVSPTTSPVSEASPPSATATAAPDSSATAVPVASPAATSSAASASSAEGQTAGVGADTPATGDIIVTAQRRSESIQKVPLTIQAFGSDALAKLNVTTLDRLLTFTPNVSFGNNGPGQGNIYIRGLSAGFAGGQSSASIANFPNVALYLDDQSMQFPARNVDIYAADLERVEVLEGPQGTLFGGGAEAGAVRYITNKPNLHVFSGRAEAAYGFTTGGDRNASGTLTLNVPIIQDRFAVRAVIYDDHRGGYIDNVPSTFTRSNNDLGNAYFNIPAVNGVCPNGRPVGATGCTLPGAPRVNNATTAQDNFNPVDYTGARVSAMLKINQDWNVLIAESLQNLKVEGISAEYPIGSDFQPLKPLQTTTFTPSYDKDDFENTAWTVNGKIGPLQLVYTGGYMTRHISQQMDYSNYSRAAYGTYYQCTGGTGGLLGAGTPLRCYAPASYWTDKVRNTHLTNEFRISTPGDKRLRAIAGAFQETFRIYDNQDFNYKTIPSCTPDNLAAAQAGGAPCLANVRTAPGSTANSPGVRDDATAFGEDLQRGYTQLAFFGSADFDIIPNVLTITGGTRYFRYREYEVGSQYSTGGSCLDVPNGQCGGGMINIDAANDRVTYTGFRSRASVLWRVTPTTSAYFTFSQGFRPGGFNRSVSPVAKDVNGVPQLIKPNGYRPDSLDNYEIGIKANLFERRLQLNLSAYNMNWKNVQFLFYNPTQLGNTSFGINGPDYNIKGLEAQFTARVTRELTLQGSASYNDAKQTNSPCLISNTGPGSGSCITEVKGVVFVNPFGSIGSTPAFSPKFQGNVRARYDWTAGEYKPFISAGVSYTGSMFNEPATYLSGEGLTIPTTTLLRYKQAAYATAEASIGVARNDWSAEIYGTNLTDSHASTFTSSAQFIKSEVPIRPRVVALRMSINF